MLMKRLACLLLVLASVAQSRRIGIDYAGEARDYPWRFYLPGNPHVSGGKRFRSHF